MQRTVNKFSNKWLGYNTVFFFCCWCSKYIFNNARDRVYRALTHVEKHRERKRFTEAPLYLNVDPPTHVDFCFETTTTTNTTVKMWQCGWVRQVKMRQLQNNLFPIVPALIKRMFCLLMFLPKVSLVFTRKELNFT